MIKAYRLTLGLKSLDESAFSGITSFKKPHESRMFSLNLRQEPHHSENHMKTENGKEKIIVTCGFTS